MKNLLIYISLSLLSFEVYAQSRRIASSYQSLPELQKKIIWGAPQKFDVPGKGNINFLFFNKAEYDLKTHSLPIYSERISLPVGTSSATVEIIDEQYAPLNDVEKLAINSYDSKTKNFISYNIKTTVTVSTIRKKPYAYIQFIPIIKNKITGSYEKLVSFNWRINPIRDANKKTPHALHTYAANSVLATGTWYKVAVAADGIYKMDYFFLKKLGLNMSSLSSSSIRVFGNGGGELPFPNSGFRYDDLQENAIYVFDQNNNNKFDSADYVLFYGQTQHRWSYSNKDKRFHHNLNIYSDSTYYFINADLGGSGKRISQQASSLSIPTNIVSTFNDYQFHEIEGENLLHSGRKWFGETFDILTSYNFNFNFSNIDQSSPVCAIIDVAARAASPGTYFNCNVGTASDIDTVTGVNTGDIYGIYFNTHPDTLCYNPTSGTVPVTISKTTPSPSIGWLNWIEVNARRKLTMTGDQMTFRDMNSVGTGNISQFNISSATSGLQVWDVTDRLNAKFQQETIIGNVLQFTLPTDSLKEFVVFSNQGFLIPVFSSVVPNQNLHALSASDLIIVTNPSFLQQANALADLHQTQDSMTVAVATTSQIFNEFSSGSQDVCAIRDFVKMFYDRAGSDSTKLPKYLLLFGRGSYDLKSPVNNTNYVPAYESLESANVTATYCADDYYGFLDDNEGNWDNPNEGDVLDIGVGRLPAKSASEAETFVNKIQKYTSVPGTIQTTNSACTSQLCYGLGDWVNRITFCSDDGELGGGDGFVQNSESIAIKVDTSNKNYNIDKIYLDAYTMVPTPGGNRYPDATAALNRDMNKGALILNWIGHGGPLGWAGTRFLEVWDINGWSNQCMLPFFFTATCDFSTWDNPALVSAGEFTLLNPLGGSIGLISTTRVVYSGPNQTLNYNFFDYVFNPLSNGKMPRLGDLERLDKNSITPTEVNHRNFALLADPALSLHYPKYNVATTQINNHPINPLLPDTAKALSKITVSGEVHDPNGNLVTNFNGIIYPTVYDKEQKIITLSNLGPSIDPPYPFMLQQNVLFKGKASVTNGKFSFTFIVPKDIAYNFGKGKISYYAHNGYVDASGNYENLIIGGTDTLAKKDVVGPNIKLYLNDDKFVYGGTTNSSPQIYAVLSDSSGINTAGTGIGHDITAILDNDNTNPLVLNDYYESDMNSYKSGSVRYSLSALADGTHTLNMRVWDVYNNSSSSSTQFIVAASAQLALKHVLNYPNPFTTKTSFYFEHNQCCTTMDVQIQIFTITGKIIKTIHQLVNMEGFRSDPIDWDGRDDFGDRIGQGVYVYRLRVKTSSNETAEQYEKLVILK